MMLMGGCFGGRWRLALGGRDLRRVKNGLIRGYLEEMG
jgi:hypothetical protein